VIAMQQAIIEPAPAQAAQETEWPNDLRLSRQVVALVAALGVGTKRKPKRKPATNPEAGLPSPPDWDILIYSHNSTMKYAALRCFHCNGRSVVPSRFGLPPMPCAACGGHGALCVRPELPSCGKRGSEAKILLLTARYQDGVRLWHPNDMGIEVSDHVERQLRRSGFFDVGSADELESAEP
jgi:hypothetical protein